jgi:hypothetical protein
VTPLIRIFTIIATFTLAFLLIWPNTKHYVDAFSLVARAANLGGRLALSLP